MTDRPVDTDRAIDTDRTADKEHASRLIASLKPEAAPGIRRTIALSLAGGLATIAQAWIAAAIITNVVVSGASLADESLRLAALAGIIVLRALLDWTAERQAAAAAARAQRKLTALTLSHVRVMGPSGMFGRPTGEIVAAIADGLRAIEPYFARYLPATTLSALIPLAILLAVVPHDWLSAVILAVTAPLIPLFMVLIGDGAERLNQRQWLTLARLSGRLLDALQGLATLKMLGAAERETAHIAALSDRYRRETMAVLRLAFLSSLVLEFFAAVAIALVAVMIGFRLLWGEMALFNGLFVLLLAPDFYLPMRKLGAAYHARMEALGFAVRLGELMTTTRASEPQQARSLRSVAGAPEVIRLDAVSVHYPDGRAALDSVDLEIRHGERIALVGPSGSGKSTILNVLLGFVSPAGGRVLVDDLSLETLEPRAWRASIAYLSQRPHMFRASIAENIAMAFDGAAIDRDRIERAARAARLSEVVERLAAGYATMVGERGFGLSGGEVQRLAVARAFYRDAPIVLLDEPTAHLDAESEAAVAAAIGELMAGRTCVIVSHRLETIRQADRIALLENGRVTRVGPASAMLDAAKLAEARS